jgi:hypothetical protein
MTNETDSEQQGQMVTRAFSVTERETGKEIILRPNSSRTVQSIALMRLGLFVPSPKSVGRQSREYKTVGFDATKELQTLSLMESEGFTNISIVGQRLDMSVDFKTWMGIIRTLANHPIDNDKISLKFTEFLKLCNPENYRSSTASRKRIDASLRRLASVMLSFTSTHSSKVYTTHLVQSALLDPDSDQVELQIDPKIFELYQYDHKVLMQLKAIKELAKKESAQALYTFIESLPPNPIPISLTRLKNRLNLKTRANSQNATVRKALEELASIGYLQYTEVKKDGKVYFQIHKRDPDLNLNNIQPPPDGDGEGDADEENNGTSGKNNGEPLEGELCPPDEPIDGDETLTIHDLTAEELHYIRSLRSQKKNNPAS